MALNNFLIGTKIREARIRAHYTQVSLAAEVGLSDAHMSYIESGTRGVSLEALVAIANVLNESVDSLLAENVLHSSVDNLRAELNAVLSDCSNYERRVLVEAMKRLKEVLIESRILTMK